MDYKKSNAPVPSAISTKSRVTVFNGAFDFL